MCLSLFGPRQGILSAMPELYSANLCDLFSTCHLTLLSNPYECACKLTILVFRSASFISCSKNSRLRRRIDQVCRCER